MWVSSGGGSSWRRCGTSASASGSRAGAASSFGSDSSDSDQGLDPGALRLVERVALERDARRFEGGGRVQGAGGVGDAKRGTGGDVAPLAAQLAAQGERGLALETRCAEHGGEGYAQACVEARGRGRCEPGGSIVSRRAGADPAWPGLAHGANSERRGRRLGIPLPCRPRSAPRGCGRRDVWEALPRARSNATSGRPDSRAPRAPGHEELDGAEARRALPVA